MRWKKHTFSAALLAAVSVFEVRSHFTRPHITLREHLKMSSVRLIFHSDCYSLDTNIHTLTLINECSRVANKRCQCGEHASLTPPQTATSNYKLITQNVHFTFGRLTANEPLAGMHENRSRPSRLPCCGPGCVSCPSPLNRRCRRARPARDC